MKLTFTSECGNPVPIASNPPAGASLEDAINDAIHAVPGWTWRWSNGATNVEPMIDIYEPHTRLTCGIWGMRIRVCDHSEDTSDCERCRTFTCNRCERRVSWDCGGADDMPALCDDCWCTVDDA